MSHRARGILNTNRPDRWMAEIHYRMPPVEGAQAVEVKTVVFEEIEDLDELIERGPDWNTIDQIVITLNRPSVFPGKSHFGG